MSSKSLSKDSTVTLSLTLSQAHLLYDIIHSVFRSKRFVSSHSCVYSDLLSVIHDLACLDVAYFKSTGLLNF